MSGEREGYPDLGPRSCRPNRRRRLMPKLDHEDSMALVRALAGLLTFSGMGAVMACLARNPWLAAGLGVLTIALFMLLWMACARAVRAAEEERDAFYQQQYQGPRDE